MKKLLLLLLAPFLLTACGPPPIFGIPQEQWDQLNAQQRNSVIDGYNQKNNTEAQVAPITAVANALASRKKQGFPAPNLSPTKKEDKGFPAPHVTPPQIHPHEIKTPLSPEEFPIVPANAKFGITPPNF